MVLPIGLWFLELFDPLEEFQGDFLAYHHLNL